MICTTALAVVFGVGTLQAAELNITEMTITGGTFGIAAPGTNVISAGGAAPIVMGAYQGVPSVTAADSLATFEFGETFGPVGTHTADDLLGAQVSVDGGALENPPAPTGTVDNVAGTISVDLGSWFAFWNGNSFNQGNHSVTGTYDTTTGTYDISWESLVTGPPFPGQTGFWNLTGVVTVDSTGPVTTLTAAILPTSRSVQVGSPATAFGTIINSGTADATGCAIAPVTTVAADFSYQTTDSATNAVTGTPDTSADIAAGGSQSYVFSFTPTAEFDSTDVDLDFDCADTNRAAVIPGVNTLLLSASTNPVADIVALAATPSGDGIVNLPGDTGSNAFAVATVNVGSQDTITASADTGTATLPVTLSICESDPATGDCLAAPAPSVTTQIDANATPTFSVFATGSGTVPFDPAANRIFVRFEDAAAVTRGSTSVAVQTE